MVSTLLCVVICFISTTVGALCGIGGGIIIKPVMDALAVADVSAIQFLSSCTVLAMASVTLLINNRHHIGAEKKSRAILIWLTLGSVPGGLAGHALFSCLRGNSQAQTVLIIQSMGMTILLLLILVYMLLRKSIKLAQVQNHCITVGAGFLMGAISSFFGIGGGPLNVLLLQLLFAMDAKQAAIGSLFVIFFSQLSSLILSFLSGGIPAFSLSLLLGMIAGGIAGGVCGRKLAPKVSNTQTETLFNICILLVLLLNLHNFISHL